MAAADPLELVQCLGCHRPLKDPDSRKRQRGRVCQEQFEGDTHVTSKPRRPGRRKRLPEDQPITGFPDLTGRTTPMATTARDHLDAYAVEDSTHLSVRGDSYEREGFAPKAFAALRAVLDLHKVVTLDLSSFCPVCRQPTSPCDTVKAITAALEAQ